MSRLIKFAELRNNMKEQMKNYEEKAGISVPYELVKHWLQTEKEYQIHLANIEAAKLYSIIKEKDQIIRDLERGVRR